ncbi:MAG: hypothetical protein KJ066_16670 [Acidobacteria bacterium]|nr:hypothetical protein [Acidobacteriota bacterium]
MDETVAKLTRALADAIAAAVAADPRVEACRAEARESGYELRLTLEATVARKGRMPARLAARGTTAISPAAPARPPLEMTASDRRFLRSLRIAPDVTPERVEE